MGKKENKNIRKVSFDELKSDKSQGKCVSHLTLNAGVLTDPNYFNDKFYTKKTVTNFMLGLRNFNNVKTHTAIYI
jgi:hypothetical protein